jgi:amino acid adenylation domain-containing protein
MQVEAFLEQPALQTPDKIALICQEARLSYAEVDRLSNRLAHALKSEGLVRGERVAIYLDNSIEAVISVFGVLKAGGIFLMINPSTKADKLAYILNDCRATGLISHTKQLEMISRGVKEVSSLRVLILAGTGSAGVQLDRIQTRGWEEALAQQAAPSAHPPTKSSIDIDLATIIYTSGSTGFPKGVMMTHLNMVTAATSISRYVENTSDDIILSALPLSFDYGLYQVLMAFKIGATIVLEKSFAYPQLIIEKLLQEKVTGFPLVPTMVAILLQMKGLVPGRFPLLRYITNTAAALPPAHIAKLRALFPATKIFSMYGLTECKRVSYLPPDQLDIRPTSVGIAIPNTEVYVVDEEGKRAAPGVVGELVVRGAHVMKGYWERKEETERALRPGLLPGEKVLYTGDLFKMDAEGFLYFVGRKDDIIKTRGEKVSPKEVEAVLYALPEVAEAAVVGVADELLGQAVKAVIVKAEGASLTEQAILLHCKRHLEDFMVPKLVEFREALPKTATGKIQKRDLGVPAERAVR